MSQRRRTGPPGRMRPGAPARPVHAAGLARWERVVFAAAFAAMAAFVAVVAVSSQGLHGPGAAPPGRGGAPAPGNGSGAPGSGRQPGLAQGGRAPESVRGQRVWDRRLAAALAPVLARRSGRVAVGVINRTTGAVAIYGAGRSFPAASVEKASILAGLLLRRQSAVGELGAGLSDGDGRLAAAMIEASSGGAAARLWHAAGGTSGMAAAGRRLGLRHTVPGPAQDWKQTMTTVGDQLTLLRDLTAASSPLSAAARSYQLSLMRGTAAGQRWGVPAAASPGTSYAVQNGYLAAGRPARWVTNSVGIVQRDHQHLLMAVLTAGQPGKAAGIATAEAAAVAAARCVTARH